jgi:hypothetical protein
MGYKIFKITYFIFVALMLLLVLLSRTGVLNFGVDAGNALTQIMILLSLFISFPIFFIVNRNKNENITINTIRFLFILVMFAGFVFTVLS